METSEKWEQDAGWRLCARCLQVRESLLGEWNAGIECDLRQYTSIFDEWEGGSKKGKERQ